jgi:hypothetical protein
MMDVRSVRPTDAPLVLSLALDDGSHLVKGRGWPEPNSLVRTLTRATLPIPFPGRSWIARDESSVALLEAQSRQNVIGWDITRLAVRGEADRVVGPVVEAAIGHLRNRGVPRLFARTCGEGAETLRALEFLPLTREHVLLGPDSSPTEHASLPIDSRYRMPSDAWPLHQLEVETTPPLVRQIMGLTSLEWSHRIKGMSEIVVERDGRIVAWMGWGVKVGPGLVQIGLLVHPQHKELAPDLLDHAVRQLEPGSRYVSRLREYQVESLRTFLDAGFQIVAEETLMVKHAAVELARTVTGRVRMASVPGIQALPIRLHPRPPHAEGNPSTAR